MYSPLSIVKHRLHVWHEVRNDFEIAANSKMEIRFSLFVSGYNRSAETDNLAVPNRNPSFRIVFINTEDNREEVEVLHISRLGFTNGSWSSHVFQVNIKICKTM